MIPPKSCDVEARETSEITTPTVVDLRLASPLAMALGRYPNSLITLKTLSLVSGFTFSGLFITRLTVASDTFAAAATS